MQIEVQVECSTAVTSPANPSTFEQSVTFTATLTFAAAAAPTGNVVFRDGNKKVATASLINGVAQFSTSLLTTGSHAISASFAESVNFAASEGSMAETIRWSCLLLFERVLNNSSMGNQT